MALVDDLHDLRARIEAHPYLELMEFRVDPPASNDAIAGVAAKLQMPIPEPVQRFYGMTNGASVRWRVKPDVPDEIKHRVRTEFTGVVSSPDVAFTLAGVIRFLSIEDSLLNPEFSLPQNQEYVGEFDFDGRTYSDNEFSAMLRPFDFIDDFFCMAFVVQPDVPNWKLMLLGDYWIEYDHTRVTWLDDYVHFAVATWGLRMARHRLFSKYRGDLDPPLQFDSERASGIVPALLTRP